MPELCRERTGILSFEYNFSINHLTKNKTIISGTKYCIIGRIFHPNEVTKLILFVQTVS